MEKQETIIYGGAFNPPTLAHLAILKACMNHARQTQAEVWVMPSGNRTDKQIETTREQRLAYIQAMIDDTRVEGVRTRTVTTELDREVMVETYDTVNELNEQHPDRHFTWFFGADSTETMAEWHGGQELLDTLSMLVVKRPGSTINPLARHAIEIMIPDMEISSTEVRRRLAEGEPVDDLVSPRVAELLLV